MKNGQMVKLTSADGTSHIWKVIATDTGRRPGQTGMVKVARPGANGKTLVTYMTPAELAEAAKGWENRESW